MEAGKIGVNLVLDSSVIIKWFCNEESSETALKLREKYVKGEITITCPDLLIYEIANALRYNKSLSENDVKRAVESILSIGIDIVVPTTEVTESAISLAYAHDLTFYDAYFLALAKELEFTFVTADEKFHYRVKKLNFVKLLIDFS